jgi:hypothetical protein
MQIGKTIIVHCYLLMLFHLARLEFLWCLNGDWGSCLEGNGRDGVWRLSLKNFAVPVEFPKLSMMANHSTATFCPDNPLNPEIYLNNI